MVIVEKHDVQVCSNFLHLNYFRYLDVKHARAQLASINRSDYFTISIGNFLRSQRKNIFKKNIRKKKEILKRISFKEERNIVKTCTRDYFRFRDSVNGRRRIIRFVSFISIRLSDPVMLHKRCSVVRGGGWKFKETKSRSFGAIFRKLLVVVSLSYEYSHCDCEYTAERAQSSSSCLSFLFLTRARPCSVQPRENCTGFSRNIRARPGCTLHGIRAGIF